MQSNTGEEPKLQESDRKTNRLSRPLPPSRNEFVSPEKRQQSALVEAAKTLSASKEFKSPANFTRSKTLASLGSFNKTQEPFKGVSATG